MRIHNKKVIMVNICLRSLFFEKVKMKRKKALNLVFTLGITLLFIFLNGKTIYSNFQNEGIKLSPFKAHFVRENIQKEIFLEGKKIIFYFATWCGPCKVELFRIKKAISNKELDPSKIYFYSTGDSLLDLENFSKKEDELLNIITSFDHYLDQTLNLTRTPTIIYLEGNEVKEVTSGISPLLVMKIRRFLEFPEKSKVQL